MVVEGKAEEAKLTTRSRRCLVETVRVNLHGSEREIFLQNFAVTTASLHIHLFV
ncbi:hypothetical protein BYT27DRAFT_7194493 [Phlegmacium glaucopus]|nr:hypothetical protein BYT27DRAFT_7194493 [Phlegmacium glaucopus]